MRNKKNITILSLGGSLICPTGEPDVNFLRRFINLIRQRIRRGECFALIIGGGKICRNYQAAAAKVRPLTIVELDWLGIKVTNLNAYFVRLAFGDMAQENIIADPTKKIKLEKPIVIGAGWKPGCSTDYDAVLLAENLGAKTVINLTNVDYVYDADPRSNSQAKPIKRLSWLELRGMFGVKWRPGLNSPFDPLAAKKARQLGLKVIIANGRNLKNLGKILNNENFRGTIISS
jgi:uridylate kinase